jgi:uncharacterized protein YbcC (UPF0753/DUF2309 family)
MTTTLAHPSQNISPKAASSEDKPNWLKHARHACLRVAPLWPLQSFVAVNPYFSMAGKPFAEVCALMQNVTHESMLMGPDYFQQQFTSGRVTTADLAAAIEQAKSSLTTADLQAWLRHPEPVPAGGQQSLADMATARFGGDWSTLVTEEMSKWCAAYFDEGQSAWRMPWKKLPLFTAWREAALIDVTSEIHGFKGFRQLVASLPEGAADALTMMMGWLGLSKEHGVDYLHRLLMTLPGWSSYVQYQVRDRAMHGRHDESLLELLAVRLVYEVQMMRQFQTSGLQELWLETFMHKSTGAGAALEKPLLWHSALEIGFQRKLCTMISTAKSGKAEAGETRPRPELQAVFCIDVRSELMRRSLEACGPRIETLGFAGFFGMPIEYVPFGQRHGSAQVPVLLSPKYRVREHLPFATADQEKKVRRQLQTGRRVSHSWNAFKSSAISCFSFVEAAGVGFAWRLVRDSFQIGKRHSHSHGPCSSCAEPNLHQHKRLVPDLLDDTQPEAGIPPEDQVQLALGALRNMGLTSGFARLVMLCGHGSNTTNNPYAAGLDCGACGGHAGDSNARVAAAILNQPAVRTALKDHGISIPDDTLFVAALHDTTTDDVTLFDAHKLPASHSADHLQLQLWLAQAGESCRSLRAASLGLSSRDADLSQLIHERSADWSQVRPEWGLAGNAAFIAAPRERTRHLNLQGRVFLHNYRADADTTQSTLELIMTAPMIVANWINMQYYASTVNNRFWGSGTKVTHNVVGTFGIQQGNGGDLRAGLPLQSVHNGEDWVHEPVRLSVFIESPREHMDQVLQKHESVRQLVENGWLHLFAIEQEGALILRRLADGSWAQV